jgi:molybdopterin-guanine dinucleotide biosynthesis protein A
MGRDKASLPFGPEQMLQRVVRLLSAAVDPQNLVVVAAADQLLPALPTSVQIARDSREYRGPLEGMATGFRTLGQRVDAVYATGCDVPLLEPAFVDHMFKWLADYDISVPVDGENYHPLAAVYRPGVLPKIEELLAADRLRPRFLFEEVRTREIDANDLRAVDPELSTLKNLNSPDDYLAALASAGFRPPHGA